MRRFILLITTLLMTLGVISVAQAEVDDLSVQIVADQTLSVGPTDTQLRFQQEFENMLGLTDETLNALDWEADRRRYRDRDRRDRRRYRDRDRRRYRDCRYYGDCRRRYPRRHLYVCHVESSRGYVYRASGEFRHRVRDRVQRQCRRDTRYYGGYCYYPDCYRTRRW